MKRISVDIGGTFTDCFVAWDGRYIQAKALTTHHNLSQGFNEALDHACATLSLQRDDVLREVDSVRYATTLGTNALIERRGPQVGVIVTAGFEATIPLSRGRGYGEGLDELARNDMSSGTRPDPLVPQTLIRSVTGTRRLLRHGPDGPRPGRHPAGAARAHRRRRRGAGGLPHQRDREPGARTAGAGGVPGRVPGAPAGRHPDAAQPPAVRPQGRVRARHLGHRGRLPARHHVPRAVGPGAEPARARLSPADADHPQLRRHGPAELDRRAADHPLRAGGRHLGERAPGRPGGPGERRGHRHGRHQLRHRPGPGRRGEALRLHAGHRPVAGQRAHDPPGHAGRRRRIHRQLRPAAPVGQGGPAQRRVGPGARLLRPRRPAAHRHRRGPAARLPHAGTLRGRPDQAEPPAGRVRHRRGVRRPPGPGPGRGRPADQGRGGRADGQRAGQGTPDPRLPAGRVHHARLRRQRPAALLRDRRPPRHGQDPRAAVQLGVLRSRRRQHAAAAHPRALGPADPVRRHQPGDIHRLRAIQRRSWPSSKPRAAPTCSGRDCRPTRSGTGSSWTCGTGTSW